MTHPANPAAVVPVVQYGYRDDDDSEDESSRGHGFLGGIINRPQAQRKGSKGGLSAFLNESASRFNESASKMVLGGGNRNHNNDDDDDGSDDSGGSKASVAEKAKKTLKNIGKGLRFGRKKQDQEESSSEEEDDDEESDRDGKRKEEESSSSEEEEEEMNRSVTSIVSQTLGRVTGKVTNVLRLGRRRNDDSDSDDEEEEDEMMAPAPSHNQRRSSENYSGHMTPDGHQRRLSERNPHDVPSAAPFVRARTSGEVGAHRSVPSKARNDGKFRQSTGSATSLSSATAPSAAPRRTHTSDNLRRSEPPISAKHSPRKTKSGSPARERHHAKVIPKEAAFAMAHDPGSLEFRHKDEMDDSDYNQQPNALFNPSAQYGKKPTPKVPDWSMNVTEELWEQAMSEAEGDEKKKGWKMNVPKKLLKDKI